jgi:hypothetical protein
MIGSLLIAVPAGLQKEINIVESNIINAIFCYYLNLSQFMRTKLKLTILFYLSIVFAILNSITFVFIKSVLSSYLSSYFAVYFPILCFV